MTSLSEYDVFVTQYLDERHLEGADRKRMMWALFYRWRERFESGGGYGRKI